MSSTTLLTLEQFEQVPREEGVEYELDQGELVPMGRNKLRHENTKFRISSQLFAFIQRRPVGRIYSEMAFVLDGSTVRIPDVAFVRQERVERAPEDKLFEGAPDLAIEVVSDTDSATALRRKIDQYLAAGTEAIWVVYPESYLVTVYEQGGVREVRADASLEAPGLLPGFSVPVRAFFE